jgi:hypothetical protein
MNYYGGCQIRSPIGIATEKPLRESSLRGLILAGLGIVPDELRALPPHLKAADRVHQFSIRHFQIMRQAI